MRTLIYSLLMLVSVMSYGQQTHINSAIKVQQTDETKWIKRYQNDIDKYKAENKTLKDRSCDILFLGSSSINLWESIYEDFASFKLIRRSYGGSTLRDMLYNYKTIAKGYQPKNIVLYVENDLGKHKEGVSAVKCFDLFRLFIGKLKKEYPTQNLIVLSLKPSIARLADLEEQKRVNVMLEANAKEQGYTYIDITKPMYDTQGNVRQDIFKEDNLHMNREGYRLWTEIITPHLKK